MSFLVVGPDGLAAAAGNFASVGSTLEGVNSAAAAPITAELAAAADDVSTAAASVLSGHGQAYQTLGAQMAQFHEQFVQALKAAGTAYASAEAKNASPLRAADQDLLGH